MSTLRFIAVAMVFAAVSVGWLVLGGVTFERTRTLDRSLSGKMRNMWGPKVLAQGAPYWTDNAAADRSDAGTVVPVASVVTADFEHESRYKGLLWYSTFTVDFSGRYTVPPADGPGAKGFFRFDVPAGSTPMDLAVTVDGVAVELPYAQRVSGRLVVPLARDAASVVSVAFKTKGQLYWLYYPGDAALTGDSDRNGDEDQAPTISNASGATGELRDFTLTVTTDFKDINYPDGSRSPTKMAVDTDAGKAATWRFDSIRSRNGLWFGFLAVVSWV
ncbi:hypothetical protein LCGC14_2866320, partial [marine sediment metagenome]